MLKIRVLNFDVNNTPIFLGCQGSQMEKKSGEEKKKKEAYSLQTCKNGLQ